LVTKGDEFRFGIRRGLVVLHQQADDHHDGPISLAGRVYSLTLGAFLLGAGAGHLTSLRREFQAQVPQWIPQDADVVVIVSGVVELSLGASLLLGWKQPYRALVGATTAAFFVTVFPGNIAQFTGHVKAFGLDTDMKRAVRLLFQPLLVASALAATNAVPVLRRSWRTRRCT
jgi:uncharacterized membrane protein